MSVPTLQGPEIAAHPRLLSGIKVEWHLPRPVLRQHLARCPKRRFGSVDQLHDDTLTGILGDLGRRARRRECLGNVIGKSGVGGQSRHTRRDRQDHGGDRFVAVFELHEIVSRLYG